MERSKILFRLSEQFLLFAKGGLDVDRLAARRFERGSNLADDFVLRFGQYFDFPQELFDLCMSQLTTRFGSGELLFKR